MTSKAWLPMTSSFRLKQSTQTTTEWSPSSPELSGATLDGSRFRSPSSPRHPIALSQDITRLTQPLCLLVFLASRSSLSSQPTAKETTGRQQPSLTASRSVQWTPGTLSEPHLKFRWWWIQLTPKELLCWCQLHLAPKCTLCLWVMWPSIQASLMLK